MPVSLTPEDQNSDAAIARKTEEVFRADRAAGLNHYVMVRTDTLKRANDLMDIYDAESGLNLALIHSGVPSKTVKSVLSELEAGTIDGIVCVSMLGEGFNFPRLKIAAIHVPHRSLEVTLQFVGRFARTNATDMARPSSSRC